MVRQEPGALPVSISELQAYVRSETGEEEAVLAALLRTATEMCETFINQALLARSFAQDVQARDGWSLIGVQPVRSVTAVRVMGEDEDLDPASYRVDIDHDGRAFLRGLPVGARCTVSGVAGQGSNGNEIPEPLRQGILRLAAHLFANRDSATGDLPKIVTALWRPYRRAGLSL